MTILAVSEVQKLRADIGHVLSRDYPEFAGLESRLPEDVLEPFLQYAALCPSIVFLEYCSTSLAQSRPEVAENRVRNLLSVLPEVGKLVSDSGDIRERSAIVSLTVAVVNDMAAQCLGTLMDDSWETRGLNQWVRGSTALAQNLPYLWNTLSKNDRLRIYMTLAGARGNIMNIIDLCRERNTLAPDFVKAYFENSSAPLGAGTL